jgi:guanylate kinase
MEEAAVFDYIVVNESLEAAVARVKEIVASEGHRTGRTQDLSGDVARIRGEIERILAEG